MTDTLMIDIGAGTVDLCPMFDAYPADEDQITVPIGGDHIDARFFTLLQEAFPDARISRRMIRQIKEKYGSVTNVYDSAIVGAVGALKLALELPPENWQRLKDEATGDAASKAA